jgi:hypothetical protein
MLSAKQEAAVKKIDRKKTIADAIEQASNEQLDRPSAIRQLHAHLNRQECEFLAERVMSGLARAHLAIFQDNHA